MSMLKLMTTICILKYMAMAEIFFYEDELIIHSSKNIVNFYINLEAVNTLGNKIAASINYFKKRESLSAGKSLVLTTFNKWLQSDAQQCAKEIKRKRNKALELSKDSLPDEIHKHKDTRKKRGFQPLGELVAYLTDMPSPSSWEKYSSLVDNLRDVVLGNMNHSNTISKTIDDITDTTKQLTTDFEDLTKKTWKLEGDLDSFKYYMQALHKLSTVCTEGNILAQQLIEEALEIDNIRTKARLNLPSEIMFPLGELYGMTRKLENKHAFPLFSNEYELEEIYAMSSSITTIDKNVIHAVLSIPLVNFNKRFKFIDIDLKEEETEVIQNLAKLARFPIDHILCGQSDQLKVLSTSKLNRCLKTQNSKVYFCNERKLTNFVHQSNRCSTLPETVLVELSTHKLLMKTTMKSMNIICNGVNKQVPINKMYNIVKLNPNCRIESKDFTIEEIRNNLQMKMNVEPFKVIGYHLPTVTFSNINNLTENRKRLIELEKSHKTLDQDQVELKKENQENHLRAKSLEEKEKKGQLISLSFGGLSVGLSLAMCTMGIIICLCKRSKKKGRGLELELGTHSNRDEKQ